MGLIPPQEAQNIVEAMKCAADSIDQCMDVEALRQHAESAGALGWPAPAIGRSVAAESRHPVKVGIVRDAAFQFYYPENLEALEEKGAILHEISSFEERPLPPLDALYIGGGFPETHLEILANNKTFRESLKSEIEAGLPVYAECGGLMFLCASIVRADCSYPMAGIFPYQVLLEAKPQGHGYTVLEVARDNPFFAEGESFKGHEFHYSRIVGCDSTFPFVFRLQKGHGIVAGWDGMCYKNTLASYSHVHAVGNDAWAEAVVRSARIHRREDTSESLDHKRIRSQECRKSLHF